MIQVFDPLIQGGNSPIVRGVHGYKGGLLQSACLFLNLGKLFRSRNIQVDGGFLVQVGNLPIHSGKILIVHSHRHRSILFQCLCPFIDFRKLFFARNIYRNRGLLIQVFDPLVIGGDCSIIGDIQGNVPVIFNVMNLPFNIRNRSIVIGKVIHPYRIRKVSDLLFQCFNGAIIGGGDIHRGISGCQSFQLLFKIVHCTAIISDQA